MGIMLALGAVWTYTEILYNRKRNLSPEKIHRIPSILTKVDYSTLLFFLGILMAVAALQIAGILDQMSTFLNDKIHNVYLINMIIGFLSSVIDNVPLVAAAMGMYPLTHTSGTLSPYLMNFTTDGTFWELLAYCSGIGGSILIIGSAAGVVVMGMERINFMWYMKHTPGLQSSVIWPESVYITYNLLYKEKRPSCPNSNTVFLFYRDILYSI